MKALVLDFGGPVLKTPFELRDIGERAEGLTPGSYTWTGPFAPSADDDWRDMQAGRMTERDYWQRRAEEFAALTGGPATFQALLRGMYDVDEDLLVRPEARAMIAHARDLGMTVIFLTNDLQAFHGREWLDRMTVLRSVDLIVDGSVEHVLKPDPAIYRLAIDRMGVEADDCLFLDDQPANVAGAEAVGMRALWFDVTDPVGSYDRARAILAAAS